MNFLNFLFKEEQPISIFDHVQEFPNDIIINGFRSAAVKRNIVLTSKTSDEKIIELYHRVGLAFIAASKKRKMYLPGRQINSIVLELLQVFEKNGEVIFNEYLSNEVAKYINEGLRQEYRKELDFLKIEL
jgi:hypothetical protein